MFVKSYFPGQKKKLRKLAIAILDTPVLLTILDDKTRPVL